MLTQGHFTVSSWSILPHEIKTCHYFLLKDENITEEGDQMPGQVLLLGHINHRVEAKATCFWMLLWNAVRY